MPYVDKETRAKLDTGMPPTGPGELNYRLTMIILDGGDKVRQQVLFSTLLAECHRYISANELNYRRINDVLGACTGAALEMLRQTRNLGIEARLLKEVAERFYDEVAAPYEEIKIGLNGPLPYFRR